MLRQKSQNHTSALKLLWGTWLGMTCRRVSSILYSICYPSMPLRQKLSRLGDKTRVASRSDRFMPQQITKLPFTWKASMPHPDKSQPCKDKRVLEIDALVSYWRGAIVSLASRKGDDAKPPLSLTVMEKVVELLAFRVFSASFFFFFGRDQFFFLHWAFKHIY